MIKYIDDVLQCHVVTREQLKKGFVKKVGDEVTIGYYICIKQVAPGLDSFLVVDPVEEREFYDRASKTICECGANFVGSAGVRPSRECQSG